MRRVGGDVFAAIRADHRRILREACAAQGGREIDTAGDGFCTAYLIADLNRPGHIYIAAKSCDWSQTNRLARALLKIAGKSAPRTASGRSPSETVLDSSPGEDC